MELGDLYPAVMTIVMIGLVLGIGIYVMSETRTNVATDYTGSDNSVNVTATSPGNTTTLSDSSKDDYLLSSVDSVINSSGDTLASTEYSFTEAGVVTWSDAQVALGNNIVNITSTFTYDAEGSPEAAINDSLESIGDFAGWLAVIVVVLAAAIVLGIVMRSFGTKQTI